MAYLSEIQALTFHDLMWQTTATEMRDLLIARDYVADPPDNEPDEDLTGYGTLEHFHYNNNAYTTVGASDTAGSNYVSALRSPSNHSSKLKSYEVLLLLEAAFEADKQAFLEAHYTADRIDEITNLRAKSSASDAANDPTVLAWGPLGSGAPDATVIGLPWWFQNVKVTAVTSPSVFRVNTTNGTANATNGYLIGSPIYMSRNDSPLHLECSQITGWTAATKELTCSPPFSQAPTTDDYVAIWSPPGAIKTVLDAKPAGRRAIQLAGLFYYMPVVFSDETTSTAIYDHEFITGKATYSTGTVQYQHSGGSSPRLVTLTGGTFPVWAGDGDILINGTVHECTSRLSDTTLQLSTAHNPGVDISAGASYALYPAGGTALTMAPAALTVLLDYWLTSYKALGGALDYLINDLEAEHQIWDFTQLSAWRAAADTAAASFEAELGWPLSALPTVRAAYSTTEFLRAIRFNTIAHAQVHRLLQEPVVDVALEHYPDLSVTDYTNTRRAQSAYMIGRAYTNRPPIGPGPNLGTHQSLDLYNNYLPTRTDRYGLEIPPHYVALTPPNNAELLPGDLATKWAAFLSCAQVIDSGLAASSKPGAYWAIYKSFGAISRDVQGSIANVIGILYNSYLADELMLHMLLGGDFLQYYNTGNGDATADQAYQAAVTLTGCTVAAATDLFTYSAHGMITCTPFKHSGSAPTASPTVDTSTVYYARRVSANTFSAHRTWEDALNGTNAINYTADGTFNLVFADYPDSRELQKCITEYKAVVTKTPTARRPSAPQRFGASYVTRTVDAGGKLYTRLTKNPLLGSSVEQNGTTLEITIGSETLSYPHGTLIEPDSPISQLGFWIEQDIPAPTDPVPEPEPEPDDSILIRSDQTIFTTNITDSYQFTALVAANVQGTKDIFLFKRNPPDTLTGDVVDSFVAVCSMADLSRYPDTAPAVGNSVVYFRDRSVSLVFPTKRQADAAYAALLAQVQALQAL